MDLKRFDVRKEMLARPNEWVGAFKVGKEWHKVGLKTADMTARETYRLAQESMRFAAVCTQKELDDCIPIEDVPKEELA